MLNSSLREEPRDQPATVIPSKHETSLLDWLESRARIIARGTQEPEYLDEEEEISELMSVDDVIYDIDTDEEIVDLEED